MQRVTVVLLLGERRGGKEGREVGVRGTGADGEGRGKVL